MGKIFVSFSVRARAVNCYMELCVSRFIEEKVDSTGASEFSLRNEEVRLFKLLFYYHENIFLTIATYF